MLRGCRDSPAWAAENAAIHAQHYPRRWVDAPRDDGNARLASRVATLNLREDAAKSAGHSNGQRDVSKPAGEDVNAAFVALGRALKHRPDVLCLQEMRAVRGTTARLAPPCCRRPRRQDSQFSPDRGLRRRLQEGWEVLTVGPHAAPLPTFTLESRCAPCASRRGGRRGSGRAAPRHGPARRPRLGAPRGAAAQWAAHDQGPSPRRRSSRPRWRATLGRAVAAAGYHSRRLQHALLQAPGSENSAARRLRAAHVTETVREEAGGRGPRHAGSRPVGLLRTQGAEPCYTSVDPAFPHCIDYANGQACSGRPCIRSRRPQA